MMNAPPSPTAVLFTDGTPVHDFSMGSLERKLLVFGGEFAHFGKKWNESSTGLYTWRRWPFALVGPLSGL
jgi:hypothetical protein